MNQTTNNSKSSSLNSNDNMLNEKTSEIKITIPVTAHPSPNINNQEQNKLNIDIRKPIAADAVSIMADIEKNSQSHREKKKYFSIMA